MGIIVKPKDFFDKCRETHNNFYDYSKSVYVDAKTKILIICPIHGEFEQLANSHKRNRGCIQCGLNRQVKLRTGSLEQCIIDANKVHNNKYSYPNAVYINARTKIKIECPIHGEFEQVPDSHVRGGSGCPECSGMEAWDGRRKTTEEYISEVKKIHNNFYSYEKTIYSGGVNKVVITCPIHGDFKQDAGKHKSGAGCQVCGDRGNPKTMGQFLKEAKEIHGELYNYSNSFYKNTDTKINIICNRCGNNFNTTPSSHLIAKSGCPKCNGGIKLSGVEWLEKFIKKHKNKYDYSEVNFTNTNCENKIKILCKKHGPFEQTIISHSKGAGCPNCKTSRGENSIAEYLDENKISYIRQHRFPDCKYKNKLSFDFYLENEGMCIEYNGGQHYKPVDRFGGLKTFTIIQIRDSIKKEYCEKNDIKLLVIRFDEDISNKLNKIFVNECQMK